ncbi:MAG: glycosyltransferase family 4 protein, partial [Nitrospinaceae bacterium]|nr:glycosyltransferase family 4 protein [Nitrospinaceae bacterium]
LYYHLEGLVSTYDCSPHLPRLAVIGDPPNLSFYYRWRNAPFSFSAQYLMFALRAFHGLYHIPKRLKKMLSYCDYKGELAAHHAAWFRKIGVTDCEYIKMPIRDDAGPDWEEKRKKAKKSRKPKIMMIGDVSATSSLAGLILFAKEVLPVLESSLGPEGFEVHIIGRGTLPADMVPLMDRPSVKIRGRVEEAAPEFLSSDILLVPTSIPLGVRTRIVVGFSFGCCVVAHTANANGTPEMVHNENALLASDGPGLAREIIRATSDTKMQKRLSFRGRETYEKYFHSDVASSFIEEKLKNVIVE